jgi:hypothetical protein
MRCFADDIYKQAGHPSTLPHRRHTFHPGTTLLETPSALLNCSNDERLDLERSTTERAPRVVSLRPCHRYHRRRQSVRGPQSRVQLPAVPSLHPSSSQAHNKFQNSRQMNEMLQSTQSGKLGLYWVTVRSWVHSSLTSSTSPSARSAQWM